MKSVRYEKINMDNYFYFILVEENFRRINNEHAVLHIYTYIDNMKGVCRKSIALFNYIY